VTWQGLLIFLAVGLTLFFGYIQYNAKIAYQPQARYFFILLLPGALLLTGGIYAFAAGWPLRTVVCTLIFIGLAVLNALGLSTIGKAGIAIGGARQHVTSRSRSRTRRGRVLDLQVTTGGYGARLAPGVLDGDLCHKKLPRVTQNYFSNLKARVASGGNWMRIECSRPIQETSSVWAPPRFPTLPPP
jgi:hypothetical protein